MTLLIFQEAQVFRAGHICCTQKPVDNAWVNFVILGDDYRSKRSGLIVNPVAGSLTEKLESCPHENALQRSPVLGRQTRHSDCLACCAASVIARICATLYPAWRRTSSRVPLAAQYSKNKTSASFRFSCARSKLSPCVFTSRLGQAPIQYFPDGVNVTSTGIMLIFSVSMWFLYLILLQKTIGELLAARADGCPGRQKETRRESAISRRRAAHETWRLLNC